MLLAENNFHFMNTATKPRGAWRVMNSHFVNTPPLKHERLYSFLIYQSPLFMFRKEYFMKATGTGTTALTFSHGPQRKPICYG